MLLSKSIMYVIIANYFIICYSKILWKCYVTSKVNHAAAHYYDTTNRNVTIQGHSGQYSNNRDEITARQFCSMHWHNTILNIFYGLSNNLTTSRTYHNFGAAVSIKSSLKKIVATFEFTINYSMNHFKNLSVECKYLQFESAKWQ